MKSIDYQEYLGSDRLMGLDGLRAFAVLAVIWHHTVPGHGGLGVHGVTLFFAISGFLITTLLAREYKIFGFIDFRKFYVRRALRIFPLYFGVLLLYAFIVYSFERNSVVGQDFWRNLKYFFTYTSNIFVPLEGRVIFYFSWSLAAEEQYYIIWPLVLLCLGAGARAVLFLMAAVGFCVHALNSGESWVLKVPLAIIFGSLFALLMNSRVGFSAVSSVFGKYWSPIAIIFLLFICLGVGDVQPYFIGFLFSGLVVACVLMSNSHITRVLQNKLLVRIGSVSYGMYMLHMLCKNTVIRLFSALNINPEAIIVFALTVILVYILALSSYKYYESFFMRYKVRYEKHVVISH